METIYYGHVPPARDRRLSKGRLGVVLRATQSVRNNIPYIAPPLFIVSPRSLLPYGREIIRARSGRGLERYRRGVGMPLYIIYLSNPYFELLKNLNEEKI